MPKKAQKRQNSRFFHIFGSYFLPKAYFLLYPNGPYPLYYIHPCLDQKENLFLFLKKAGTSEHCVINIIIIFWFIIISEIGPNRQCSKIVNFNRTEAGLTSKWGRISPAVQWCYQDSSNCTVQL